MVIASVWMMRANMDTQRILWSRGAPMPWQVISAPRRPMSMRRWHYRWAGGVADQCRHHRFRAAAQPVRVLERSILRVVGIALVHETPVGPVELLGDVGVAWWKARRRVLPAEAPQ